MNWSNAFKIKWVNFVWTKIYEDHRTPASDSNEMPKMLCETYFECGRIAKKKNLQKSTSIKQKWCGRVSEHLLNLNVMSFYSSLSLSLSWLYSSVETNIHTIKDSTTFLIKEKLCNKKVSVRSIHLVIFAPEYNSKTNERRIKYKNDENDGWHRIY